MFFEIDSYLLHLNHKNDGKLFIERIITSKINKLTSVFFICLSSDIDNKNTPINAWEIFQLLEKRPFTRNTMQHSNFSCLKKNWNAAMILLVEYNVDQQTFSSYLSDFNSIWFYILKWQRADVAKFVSCLNSKRCVSILLHFEQRSTF